MKKILTAILVIATMLFITACNRSAELEMYLSQVRTSIYKCQTADYTVTVYGEEKETPFLSDGFVGTIKKYVTVKIENFTKSPDDAQVDIYYGDISLSGRFEYNPLNGKFTAVLDAQVLPTGDIINVVIKNGENEQALVAKNVISNEVIDYKKALKSVSSKAGSKINKMLDAGGNSIEVRLRILMEGNRPYYYVSAIEKSGKTIAFLVDGLNGEVLAEREFN